MPACAYVAHRGYPARYPENTRLGFEQALAAGARYLEADLQLTADGVPVLFHDRTLDRLCGRPGVIHRHTLAELATVSPHDPGRFGARFRGEPVLTLDGLVELLAAHPGVVLFLELKRIALKAFGVRRVLDRVLPRLAPVAEQTVLISFSLFVLKAARARGWTALGPVLTRWSQLNSPTVRQLDPDYLFLSHLRLPLGLCYDRLRPVLALYETSDPARARALLARGAGLIETDAIGELLAAGERGDA